MTYRLLATAVVAVALIAAVNAPRWKVEEESAVRFTAYQSGAPVTGEFEEFTAEIFFDREALAESRVEVEIDVASVDTESRDRDQTIRSDALFAVDAYPKAVFRADGFEEEGEGRYVAVGTLRIRDVTQDVRMPFTLEFEEDGKTAIADGKLTIQRLDYGVGQGDWQDTSIVANEVDIEIHIVATRHND